MLITQQHKPISLTLLQEYDKTYILNIFDYDNYYI